VDRWTSNGNSEKKDTNLTYIFSFESANILARSCLSISCFPSVLQNFDKKVWRGGQVMKILKKIVSASCIVLFERVDMWTRRCLSIPYFSFCYVIFTILTKSVDRWTSNENSENKF
jgi:hypothetical protein